MKNRFLTIDEIIGRKAAKEMGIPVTGSICVLISAKNNGHQKAVKPIIDKIQKTNFRSSNALIERALDKESES